MTINMVKTPCIEDSENTETIRRVGWAASPKHIHEESHWYLRWLVGTKHFPEFKNTSQNPKHNPESKTLPRIQKHFPKSKTHPRIQNNFGFWDVFCILGSVFTFWEVFWILGHIFVFWDVFWTPGCIFISGKRFRFCEVFVPMSHSKSGIYLWFLQRSVISLRPLRPCIWCPTALSHMSHTWCPQVPESPHTRPNVRVPLSPVPVLYTAINFLHTGVIRNNILETLTAI